MQVVPTAPNSTEVQHGKTAAGASYSWVQSAGAAFRDAFNAVVYGSMRSDSSHAFLCTQKNAQGGIELKDGKPAVLVRTGDAADAMKTARDHIPDAECAAMGPLSSLSTDNFRIGAAAKSSPTPT